MRDDNVIKLHETFEDVVNAAIQQYPTAKEAIIIIFEGDAWNMHTHYKANCAQLALAGANLLRLSGEL